MAGVAAGDPNARTDRFSKQSGRRLVGRALAQKPRRSSTAKKGKRLQNSSITLNDLEGWTGERVKEAKEHTAHTSEPLPELAAAVREVILDPDIKAFDKRRQVCQLIRNALLAHGQLCRTRDERAFYFSNDVRTLYDLDQAAFGHLLTNLSCLSPTETDFRFSVSMLRADAAQSPTVEVHALAHFDPANCTLSISDGGTGVWVYRDGEWKFSYNGQGLFFLTEPDAAAWKPDFSASHSELDWLLEKIPFA